MIAMETRSDYTIAIDQKKILLRLSADLHRRIQLAAKRRKRSMNGQILMIVENWLNENEK